MICMAAMSGRSAHRVGEDIDAETLGPLLDGLASVPVPVRAADAAVTGGKVRLRVPNS
jgi:hypothetical protein